MYFTIPAKQGPKTLCSKDYSNQQRTWSDRMVTLGKCIGILEHYHGVADYGYDHLSEGSVYCFGGYKEEFGGVCSVLKWL